MIKTCPHCGGTTYYIKQRISGYGNWYDDTSGKEVDNADFGDGVTYANVGKYAYCAECGKRFAKIEELI